MEYFTELSTDLLKKLEKETNVLWEGGCKPTIADFEEDRWLYFVEGVLVHSQDSNIVRAQVVMQAQFLKIVKEVCPKKWAPREGDMVYIACVDIYENLWRPYSWKSCTMSTLLYKRGIVFKTKDEAHTATLKMLASLDVSNEEV